MNKNISIIGGGLAGLITACYFKNAEVYEAGSKVPQHRALLRFRGEEVSKLTGIPFRAVNVDKAVVYGNQTYQGRCPIDLANMYSLKVTGRIGSRSIMKLESATRYIAPDDFYEQLIHRVGDRVWFDHPIDKPCLDSLLRDGPVISTIPMQLMMGILEMEKHAQVPFAFERQAIKVYRFKLNVPCDVYQTIYFPAADLRTYRASITGDTAIIEMINTTPYGWSTAFNDMGQEVAYVMGKFGVLPHMYNDEDVELVDQKYGKIVDIPADIRHGVLFEMTMSHNVFSIGRFATWRNILLDDVAEDIKQVDQLINASDYARFKFLK